MFQESGIRRSEKDNHFLFFTTVLEYVNPGSRVNGTSQSGPYSAAMANASAASITIEVLPNLFAIATRRNIVSAPHPALASHDQVLIVRTRLWRGVYVRHHENRPEIQCPDTPRSLFVSQLLPFPCFRVRLLHIQATLNASFSKTVCLDKNFT
jgi:hypothetical protein